MVDVIICNAKIVKPIFVGSVYKLLKNRIYATIIWQKIVEVYSIILSMECIDLDEILLINSEIKIMGIKIILSFFYTISEFLVLMNSL